MENNVTKRIKLKAENVMAVFGRCFYEEDELEDGRPPADCVNVHGIMNYYGFNPHRLKEEEENIKGMLSELPAEFKNGWTFLNLCNDKNGRQWTGSHIVMEALMVLGIAIGKIEYLMPRERWRILPGGVPYVILKE